MWGEGRGDAACVMLGSSLHGRKQQNMSAASGEQVSRGKRRCAPIKDTAAAGHMPHHYIATSTQATACTACRATPSPYPGTTATALTPHPAPSPGKPTIASPLTLASGMYLRMLSMMALYRWCV